MTYVVFACTEPKVHRMAGRWRISHWRHNHSAFNGYHETNSDYSEILCLECHRSWRTKAAYVETLKHLSETEKNQWLGVCP